MTSGGARAAEAHSVVGCGYAEPTVPLCADITGYARLMEDDEEEEGTVRTLRSWREQTGALVVEHRGRVADFTGDNFLASFPTAQNLVACAIEIQRVLRALNAGLRADRRMEFRVGAHLGDVRSEGERLFGDGMNIAARLQAPRGSLDTASRSVAYALGARPASPRRDA